MKGGRADALTLPWHKQGKRGKFLYFAINGATSMRDLRDKPADLDLLQSLPEQRRGRELAPLEFGPILIAEPPMVARPARFLPLSRAVMTRLIIGFCGAASLFYAAGILTGLSLALHPDLPAAPLPVAPPPAMAKIIEPAKLPAPDFAVSAPMAVETRSAAPAKSKGGGYIVGIGAFTQSDNAELLIREMSLLALPSFKLERHGANGRDLILVYLGPFGDRDAAEKARDRARGDGVPDPMPINYRDSPLSDEN